MIRKIFPTGGILQGSPKFMLPYQDESEADSPSFSSRLVSKKKCRKLLQSYQVAVNRMSLQQVQIKQALTENSPKPLQPNRI